MQVQGAPLPWHASMHDVYLGSAGSAGPTYRTLHSGDRLVHVCDYKRVNYCSRLQWRRLRLHRGATRLVILPAPLCRIAPLLSAREHSSYVVFRRSFQ